MKLTWLLKDEWWGIHASTRHEDYIVSVMFMRDAGNCIWRIDEDYRTRARGVCPGSVDKAQLMVSNKLRRLIWQDRFNTLIRRNRYASSAA
jgi:hypothetical protein